MALSANQGISDPSKEGSGPNHGAHRKSLAKTGAAHVRQCAKAATLTAEARDLLTAALMASASREALKQIFGALASTCSLYELYSQYTVKSKVILPVDMGFSVPWLKFLAPITSP